MCQAADRAINGKNIALAVVKYGVNPSTSITISNLGTNLQLPHMGDIKITSGQVNHILAYRSVLHAEATFL